MPYAVHKIRESLLKVAIKRSALLIASAGLLSVFGCGGNSTNTAINVPVTVIDGPIGNATVCLDKNDNGTCDSGEPSGRTDSAGKVTLKVDVADAGKYPVIAVVGTDAADADTGPVPVAFTLKAPADHVALITPLTTLVQTMVENTGLSSTAAESQVKAQVGIDVSLFEDFSQGTTDRHKAAAMAARMLVLAAQQQSAALAGAVGATAIDGTTISQADLDKAIQNRMLEILPTVLAALADPVVQAAAPGAAREAELLKQAQGLIAPANGGLTAAALRTVVAINRPAGNSRADDPAEATASASLLNLWFRSVSDWSLKVASSSAVQNTPAADGSRRYRELFIAQVSGAVPFNWDPFSNPFFAAMVHWNGSAWVTCPGNYETTKSAPDAFGNRQYNFCDGLITGSGKGTTFDVSGRKMVDVYDELVAAGYSNLNIDAATSVLGATTFPAGSQLTYGRSTILTGAETYYADPFPSVTQYSAAVAAGGVASTQAADFGCNSAEFSGRGTPSTTLESMASATTGTPCIFGQGSFEYLGTTYTSPDATEEAWGNSTLGIGTLGGLPVGTAMTPDYYTSYRQIRIAFKGAGSNPVTFYACKVRFIDGSPRNCSVVGAGSYSIVTQGDARVMTLNNLPASVSSMPVLRVFVERANLVHLGLQEKPRASRGAQLNLTGLNALFSALGLPAFDPNNPPVLSAGPPAMSFSR